MSDNPYAEQLEPAKKPPRRPISLSRALFSVILIVLLSWVIGVFSWVEEKQNEFFGEAQYGRLDGEYLELEANRRRYKPLDPPPAYLSPNEKNPEVSSEPKFDWERQSSYELEYRRGVAVWNEEKQLSEPLSDHRWYPVAGPVFVRRNAQWVLND